MTSYDRTFPLRTVSLFKIFSHLIGNINNRILERTIFPTVSSSSSSSNIVHTVAIVIIKFGINSDTIIVTISHYGQFFPQNLIIVTIVQPSIFCFLILIGSGRILSAVFYERPRRTFLVPSKINRSYDEEDRFALTIIPVSSTYCTELIIYYDRRRRRRRRSPTHLFLEELKPTSGLGRVFFYEQYLRSINTCQRYSSWMPCRRHRIWFTHIGSTSFWLNMSVNLMLRFLFNLRWRYNFRRLY